MYGSVETKLEYAEKKRAKQNRFLQWFDAEVNMRNFICITLGVCAALAVIMMVGSRARSNFLSEIADRSAANQPGVLPRHSNSIHRLHNPFQMPVRANLAQESAIRRRLQREFSNERIKETLRRVTSKLHVAGTPENMEAIETLAKGYEEYGLEVKREDYEVLLSYPDYNRPNTIHVRSQAGVGWDELSNGLSRPYGPPEALHQESDPRALVWWNAYAKNGSVVAPLVYANFGSAEDFDYLVNHGIVVRGSIALVRYGGQWRGEKVSEAERHGAVGVIIYSDPQQYGPPPPLTPGDTFAKTIYLPPDGAQRGSLLQTDGDPTTPFYPSKPYVYRSKTVEELRKELIMPNVPVMPIGYRDARKIFEHMDGPHAPTEFTGTMPGVTYRLSSGGSSEFKLTVRTTSPTRKIRNIIATVTGREESDQLVLFSNHEDAWTFGSQDPNLGSAIMLEMARVLQHTINQTGWRPRRSMVFCSWDAEEYSLIGSNEWVEQQIKVLEARAVALINVDVAVKGNDTLTVKGVPLLYQAVVDASKSVNNPNLEEVKLGRSTIYDSWMHYEKEQPALLHSGIPTIGLPGSGSDHQRFISYAGVPVIDMGYKASPGVYPLYHSLYEVAWTVENLVDPSFNVSVAMGRLWLEVGRSLADSLAIPFNLNDYAAMLKDQYVKGLVALLLKKKMDQPDRIPNFNQVTAGIRDAVTRFTRAASKVQTEVSKANRGHAMTLKQVLMLNERLLQLERAFIEPRGIYPERSDQRHVIFAKSLHDSYSGQAFAGIVDCLEYFGKAVKSGEVEQQKRWLAEIRLGLTKVQYTIESAILLLELPDIAYM